MDKKKPLKPVAEPVEPDRMMKSENGIPLTFGPDRKDKGRDLKK